MAGVEAQTEKVWRQANNYRIPRLIYVNKLDRDGAAFDRTVKEMASRLDTFPLLCQIPWWKNGVFKGVADVVGLQALEWPDGGDGSAIKYYSLSELERLDPTFAEEVKKARIALVEALTEEDDQIVESFLEANEDWLAIAPDVIWRSLRKCVLSSNQAVTPVFAGASFRNIGVQPLLNAVNDLLPSPTEAPDPDVSLGGTHTTMTKFIEGETSLVQVGGKSKGKKEISGSLSNHVRNLTGLGLAFKVVNDSRRGVLVYVRVYHGSITRNCVLYNTNLSVSERSVRLMRMYASDAVEIESIDAGQIGVIAGLKYARTGDTLLVYHGLNPSKSPPAPIDTLQLRPIEVPPPLFFTSVEPNSLAEEKSLNQTIGLLLREDPSLSVSVDSESGQTHLSGMGELHLEIARDRLINDFKVKAKMGSIEISYRESPSAASGSVTEVFDKDIAGKPAMASCTASLGPVDQENLPASSSSGNRGHTEVMNLADSNILSIHYPTLDRSGKAVGGTPSLPSSISLSAITNAFMTGVSAALSRGPTYNLPLQLTHVEISFDPVEHLTSTSTPAALSSAARLATKAALKAASTVSENGMMEPVMLATIAVSEEDMGKVVHDLSSARGAQVLALDSEEELAEGVSKSAPGASTEASAGLVPSKKLTTQQLARVYAPPDPFGASDAGGADRGSANASVPRQIRARVPLKEMVGYLKRLRSLTGGRGTFVMSVDQYERMNPQRVKEAVKELRGEFA